MFISKDIEYKIKVWAEKEDAVPSSRRRKLSFSQSHTSSTVSHITNYDEPDNNIEMKEIKDMEVNNSDKKSSSFGFDVSLPDISLSEYLSFSSKDQKKEKEKVPDNEPSWWDRMSFSSPTPSTSASKKN
jgi:hypothetical protein